MPPISLSRRHALLALSALTLAPKDGWGFGDAGAFNPRVLKAGGVTLDSVRASAPARWAWEVVRRTSAPARMVQSEVAADNPVLHSSPFVLWAGGGEVSPLSSPEIRGLEKLIRLGGVLVVDDTDPARGAFGKGARRELRRVLPEAAPIKLDASHVIFKSYYIVDRPVGRVLGPPSVEAIVRGKNAQVLFLSHDLLGALARSRAGTASLQVEPGGPVQREQAIRFAVNIAMYVLCSDYKDDQVHAPFLMRRRARRRP
jgi:hypothetical protein